MSIGESPVERGCKKEKGKLNRKKEKGNFEPAESCRARSIRLRQGPRG